MSIPLYKPEIGLDEENAVMRVLRSGFLSKGKEVQVFETEFALYVDKKYAVAVNSGTSGLHLAVRALGWKTGDEIITTPFSYIASSNALLYEGIKPIFVDIDRKTLNIDINELEKKITSKTRGILLVHIFGLPSERNRFLKLVKKYKLQVIEDACEAIGRPTEDFPVGTYGDVSIYGFFENKQMTSGGEGGMIVTNDKKVYNLCKSMRDQGRSLKKNNWIDNVILGFNYRITEIQAAFGRVQLRKLDQMLIKRKILSNLYNRLLQNTNVETPFLSHFSRSWFVYFVLFKNKNIRHRIKKILDKEGIKNSDSYFPPITHFPLYRYDKFRYPVCESISEILLALPLFTSLSEESIKHICKIIKENT